MPPPHTGEPMRRLRLIGRHHAYPDAGDTRWASPGLAVLAVALTVYAAFNAGGFFAGTPAVLATALAVGLVLRIALADQPFAGIGVRLLIPIGALGLYAVWVLVSAAWSHAPGRAFVEFDRALMYLLVLVTFGAWPGSPRRSRWLIRGIAIAFVAVCAAALVSRLLPDVLATSPTLHNERLSYPLTYWNALGLMAAIAAVLCLHLASSLAEPLAMRAFGAGALPLLGTVLYFTFSRGAIAAGVVGVLVFAIVGRSRSLAIGLLAGAPAAAIAVGVAYGAGLLAQPDLTSSAATAQGHRVAVVIAACVAGAVVLRVVLGPLERRLARTRLPVRAGRGGRLVAWVLLLVAVILTASVLRLPARVDHAVSQFGHASPAVAGHRDFRQRFSDASNNGRLDLWRVSLQSFGAHPLHGRGAGTFQTQWLRSRPNTDRVNDGHSLYMETLGELGVVGAVLIAVLVGSILIGLGRLARRSERTIPSAVVLAATVAWALHAGIDWDWEMPAVTLWLFAAAGTLLATPTESESRRAYSVWPGRRTRVLSGIACLVIAVTPVRLALSQAGLNESLVAFKRGDCGRAIDRGLSSISAFSERPEPYEVVAYCDLRVGQPDLGVGLMQRAVLLDPADSELRYGLALLRAAAGQDPRPDARASLRLDPLGALSRQAVRRFSGASARSWRREALDAPLPVGL